MVFLIIGWPTTSYFIVSLKIHMISNSLLSSPWDQPLRYPPLRCQPLRHQSLRNQPLRHQRLRHQPLRHQPLRQQHLRHQPSHVGHYRPSLVYGSMTSRLRHCHGIQLRSI